jgi:hypothetical protein
MILKIVLKAGHENQPMREKESLNTNLIRLSKQSLELVVFSKKQAENLFLFFSLTRQVKNLKHHVQIVLI